MTRLVAVGAVLVLAVVAISVRPAVAADICAPRSIGVSDTARFEGGLVPAATMTFTVWSTGCAGGTVQFATGAGAGGAVPMAESGFDYVPASGELAWPPGDTTSRTVVVEIVGDYVVEPDEVFALELLSPVGLTLADPVGLGTIRNDDVRITPLGKPHCLESCVDCRLRVITSEPAPVDLTIHFATEDGSATAGADYTAISDGSLTIPAGASAAELSIRVRDDRVVEREEYFYVRLYEPSAGEITEDRVAMGIVDDDGRDRG
ncbi:Calx-beta domain-containing protein [Micromonospora sp. WMMA1363]|uniref:Calx-beta domain-containing protein n=1 Tax=Micromonospora sp. WMMA1363 TaxID=3053985 RepID=UPI00259D26E6|nr:Calx-beta domain-containing protein [Micromonospora sp. WMMA1363]MDM4721468.1 Calx-beta domain-containing protein [Micromonospora sp. WMMA1363]